MQEGQREWAGLWLPTRDYRVPGRYRGQGMHTFSVLPKGHSFMVLVRRQ